MSNPLQKYWPEEYDAVREIMRQQREAAYRRALRATGHAEKSVEIMVDRDRAWLDNGDDKPEA